MTLYKVLIDTRNGMRSLYVDYTDYLPYEIRGRDGGNQWIPGLWTPWITRAHPYALIDGYHLTEKPTLHGLPGDVVFEAEGRGGYGCVDDQWAFASIRLLKRLTEAEINV